MTPTPIVHSTFVVERTYPFSAARVFAAFSDPATKRRWFAEGEGWQIDEFTVDFRVGGRETSRFRFQGGPPMANDTVYHDIVPDERIVFAYAMTIGDKRISVSLASVELFAAGKGTRIVYTEQGQFFDGAEQPKQRELGCAELFGKLLEELERGNERGHS
jgi:uncharacterized protein YndB with AHSA1/START domain